MYGVITRNKSEVTWPEFDRAFYEVKDVTGRTADPVESSTSMISCFGDSRVEKETPSLVPVSKDGDRATRERKYFDWSYVCPNATTYRGQLLNQIETAAGVTTDLRLDDIGFPRPEYCHCERCEEAFSDSDIDNWWEWRNSVITQFVQDASDRIPGRVYMTLYPDPFPGHLSRRAGIELDALAQYVDEFVVPLYDMAYETTYWIEIIAQGFQEALTNPFSIELYAVNIDHDNLVQASTVANNYSHSVLYAYDAEAASAAVTELCERDTAEST